MSNLITPDELRKLARSPELVIADCRFDLAAPSRGMELFLQGRIPGAVYASLDERLSAPLGIHGGRHPLPDASSMAAVFGGLGIACNRTRVVVYDDAGGSFAARMWWMLRYLGHENVRLLDGGWQAWLSAGGEVETGQPAAAAPADFGAFEARGWMLADKDDVKSRGADKALVDARAPERYSGAMESIDIKAGHIPGARHLYWQGNLDCSLRFLTQEALRSRYAALAGRMVIMYCGSGVTSCLNVLAMEEAGLGMPRLYVGSWSDWISYPENPVATGNEAG